MPQISVSDGNVSADAAGASGPQGPESPRRRALAYLPVALLVAAILAGIYYYFQVYELRSKQDGLGLLVAAYIRETVPGLRTPQYWPVHGPRGTTRNPNDIAFVYSSDAFEGACNYWMLDNCLAFRVSSEILARPEQLASLVRFVENPCASFAGSSEQERAAFKTKSVDELRRLEQRQRHKVLVWRFFACDDGKQKPSTLILNFADAMDDRTRVGDFGMIRHRIVIVREYR